MFHRSQDTFFCGPFSSHLKLLKKHANTRSCLNAAKSRWKGRTCRLCASLILTYKYCFNHQNEAKNKIVSIWKHWHLLPCNLNVSPLCTWSLLLSVCWRHKVLLIGCQVYLNRKGSATLKRGWASGPKSSWLRMTSHAWLLSMWSNRSWTDVNTPPYTHKYTHTHTHTHYIFLAPGTSESYWEAVLAVSMCQGPWIARAGIDSPDCMPG